MMGLNGFRGLPAVFLDLTLESSPECTILRMKSETFRIGEVANRSGVSIDTVRYYERRKLLPRPARSGGGFRLFTLESIERVKFIKQAQELGLSLDEINELLTTGGAQECQRVREILQAKLTELDERMKMMRAFRRTLSQHLTACEKELSERGSKALCPVLVNLSHPQTKRK
jgi:DNA-binding transcriptional MerR regulator